MAPQDALHRASRPTANRLELGDGPASPDDREPFPPVLDGVEKVGEVAGSVGRAHLGHEIRLSDRRRSRARTTRAARTVTPLRNRPGPVAPGGPRSDRIWSSADSGG